MTAGVKICIRLFQFDESLQRRFKRNVPFRILLIFSCCMSSITTLRFYDFFDRAVFNSFFQHSWVKSMIFCRCLFNKYGTLFCLLVLNWCRSKMHALLVSPPTVCTTHLYKLSIFFVKRPSASKIDSIYIVTRYFI